MLTVDCWQQFGITTLDSWDLPLPRDFLIMVAKGTPLPILGYYKIKSNVISAFSYEKLGFEIGSSTQMN